MAQWSQSPAQCDEPAEAAATAAPIQRVELGMQIDVHDRNAHAGPEEDSGDGQ